MKVRGFENGVWSGTTPTAAPRSDGPYRLLNGSYHLQCGHCGLWTPVWGAGKVRIGHWSWMPNPYFGRFNPRLGHADDRERIPIPKTRTVEACPDCVYLGLTATRPWLPDDIQKNRDAKSEGRHVEK